MDGILKIPIQKTTISLRVKILILVGVILIALVALASIFARVILLHSFADLEAQRVDRNVQRVLHALDRELHVQAVTNADWAHWDGSYQFVQDGNAEFIAANLPDQTFELLTINVIAFLDTAGQPVWARAYDLQAGEVIALPTGVEMFTAINSAPPFPSRP